MKQEMQEKTVNGITFENSSYSFTDSEKADIARFLPKKQFFKEQAKIVATKYPEVPADNSEPCMRQAFEECASMFFTELEGYCNTFLWIKSFPNIAEHREALQDMLKTFRKAMKYLDKICKNKLSIPAERSIALSEELFVSSLIRQFTVERSFVAHEALKFLCSTIDGCVEGKMERGAPPRATTAFATEIAKAYRIAFGMMPTAQKTGSFARIFDAVMEIVSPQDDTGDYSRALKAAIQNLTQL